MKSLLDKTIGEIVAEDYRAAAVFSKNNIDFCCGGQKTIKNVCETNQINSDAVVAELEQVLATKTDSQIDYRSWPLDLLSDYVVKTHHRYVREKTPLLRQYLHKICHVHGENHPELFEINSLFIAGSDALYEHMEKEESILFPYIGKLVESGLNGTEAKSDLFSSIKEPIDQMEEEHETEGERFRKIAELSDNYTPPADACGTYRVTFSMLDEYEKDLHKHIHLENNIMFPGAIAMEGNLSEV